jgi:hypothetical protein
MQAAISVGVSHPLEYFQIVRLHFLSPISFCIQTSRTLRCHVAILVETASGCGIYRTSARKLSKKNEQLLIRFALIKSAMHISMCWI